MYYPNRFAKYYGEIKSKKEPIISNTEETSIQYFIWYPPAIPMYDTTQEVVAKDILVNSSDDLESITSYFDCTFIYHRNHKQIDIGGLRRSYKTRVFTFFENLVYFIMNFFNRVSAVTFFITLVDIDNIQRKKDFFNGNKYMWSV